MSTTHNLLIAHYNVRTTYNIFIMHYNISMFIVIAGGIVGVFNNL
jgi:hypothetical protein